MIQEMVAVMTMVMVLHPTHGMEGTRIVRDLERLQEEEMITLIIHAVPPAQIDTPQLTTTIHDEQVGDPIPILTGPRLAVRMLLHMVIPIETRATRIVPAMGQVMLRVVPALGPALDRPVAIPPTALLLVLWEHLVIVLLLEAEVQSVSAVPPAMVEAVVPDPQLGVALQEREVLLEREALPEPVTAEATLRP